ncbi:hypothetical protein [Micromonospora sediminicola]|uniref:hypothetical protein n=1 Tax=Micromonospora sediminicola TaxID=946078 RepID=UPI0037B1C883
MKGLPLLREAGWLREGGRWTALVRLYEHRERAGVWEIQLHDPARCGRAERQDFLFEGEDAEPAARAALADVYRQGEECGGRWETHSYPHPDEARPDVTQRDA